MADSGFYTKIMPKNAQKNEHISKTAWVTAYWLGEGCYYQQSPPIATFTYAKGWKEKFKHVNIFKSTVE